MNLPFQPISSGLISEVAPHLGQLPEVSSSVPRAAVRRLTPRRCVLLVALALALAQLGFAHGEVASLYRRWRLNNTLLLGQKWLKAGRLERAADSVGQALALNPNRPEPWRLASQLAWRRAQKAQAFALAARAARVSGNRIDYVLAWAELALAGADLTEADHALATLAPEALRNSSRALRLSAELASRQGDGRTARDLLRATIALDHKVKSPDLRSDEAQLGTVLLSTGIGGDRRQGLELLGHCAESKDVFGRFALRVLLADSVNEANSAATSRWAQALLDHPLCTMADTQSCLAAAGHADDATFRILFASIKAKLATSQLRSAELLQWLSQIGRTKEALAWARAVNSVDVTSPPLFVAVAETFRQACQWRELENWTGLSDWGSGVGLMQLAYRWIALSNLGAAEEAEAVLTKLKGDAPGKGSQALLVAQLLYTWGETDRSVDLLWSINNTPPVDIQASGMLIRHYQMRRDCAGLYRAFEAWRSLRPNDQTAAASCALFGSLSGAGDPPKWEAMAAESLRSDPSSEYFRCCYAVVMAVGGRAPEALAAVAPISSRWRKSHSIAFAYGLALAAADRKAEAREVLGSIDPTAMPGRKAGRCAVLLRGLLTTAR